MLYLLKGKEAFDRPNRASQSHGHALGDAPVYVIDSGKFYPWYQIKPIAQEFMSIVIDNNYPDWFVHSGDCVIGTPPTPVTPPEPDTVSDGDAGLAFVILMKWVASLWK